MPFFNKERSHASPGRRMAALLRAFSQEPSIGEYAHLRSGRDMQATYAQLHNQLVKLQNHIDLELLGAKTVHLAMP